MSRTDDIEQQARERRWAQSGKLQDWAIELKALADQMWNEDSDNGWHVQYMPSRSYTHC